MTIRRLSATTVLILAIGLAALLLFASSPRLHAADETKNTGFDVSNLDRTCKPCDDFYQFATGGWIKNNPIPADYPAWGGFITLADKNQQHLHDILESVTHSQPASGSNEQKIGDFYTSCMDTSAIDAAGIKPISGELAAIAAVHDVPDLIQAAAMVQREGGNALFGFGPDQDFKDSSRVIGEVNQGGLGLPDRDYYTRDDPGSKKLRDQYLGHVGKMLQLAGDSPDKAESEAEAILPIETSLARASLTNVQRRVPETQYHMMSIAGAQALTPHLPWQSYFRAVGGLSLTEINIAQPDFFKALDEMLTSVPLSQWKDYLRWHLINASASALSDLFVQEDFAFSGRILTGSQELRSRWKRCTGATDRNLGEALGQVYVEKYFPPEAKTHAQVMVQDLIAALHSDIPTLSWMEPATKKAAIAKLEAFHVKIGYPGKWRDYSNLKIDRGPYISNLWRAREFEFNRQASKIGKPVDHNEWVMTPPTVDAYNDSQRNEIVFPAGILQPPFYDANRDDAYNYGGMGAVIGHEITHGFDDEGAKFDLKGNLKNWWTPDDLRNFQNRGDCVAKQFDSYVVEGDLHQNGKLVEGESIADLGGLTIAYAAFEKSLKGKPQEKDANGFTPEQRFFLGYAQIWASNIRPELAKLFANTNPHPLPHFRVIGATSNLAEFAKAFDCKRTDPMVRPQVCKIW